MLLKPHVSPRHPRPFRNLVIPVSEGASKFHDAEVSLLAFHESEFTCDCVKSYRSKIASIGSVRSDLVASGFQMLEIVPAEFCESGVYCIGSHVPGIVGIGFAASLSGPSQSSALIPRVLFPWFHESKAAVSDFTSTRLPVLSPTRYRPAMGNIAVLVSSPSAGRST